MRSKIRLVARYAGGFVLVVALGLPAYLVFAYNAAKNSVFDPGVTPIAADRIIIRNVRIVTDGADAPSPPSNVVIEGGRIASVFEIGTEVGPAGDGLEIDGEGRYLLPGLIDMHAHIFDRSDLALYLAHGVTTTRNMMGYPAHLRWQSESHEPRFAGARMITSSPTLNSGAYVPFHAMVRSAEAARTRVRQFHDEGYSFIKVYDGLGLDIYDAILEEARALGLDIAGHVPRNLPFERALDGEFVSIEHIEEIYYYPLDYSKSGGEHQAVADEIASHPVAVSTTLTAYYNIYRMASDGDAFLRSVPMDWMTPVTQFFGERAAAGYLDAEDPEAYLRKYRALQSITRRLYDSGTPLLLATDTGPALTVPGYSVHREIERLQELNIPASGILAMGTTNAAAVLGEKDVLGTIRAGASADLILVSENPLVDIATLEHPEIVIKGGEIYDQAALVSLLEAGRQHISWTVTIGQIVEQLFAYGI